MSACDWDTIVDGDVYNTYKEEERQRGEGKMLMKDNTTETTIIIIKTSIATGYELLFMVIVENCLINLVLKNTQMDIKFDLCFEKLITIKIWVDRVYCSVVCFGSKIF